MTDPDRRFLAEKYGQLLHEALVEMRALSYQEGNARRVNDLADLTHNVPLFLTGRDECVPAYLRAGFVDYARKYCPEFPPETHRYVALLDMDEATFADRYLRTTWAWPEPALAPAG